MLKIRYTSLLFFAMYVAAASAETPLSKAFADLQSSDASLVQTTKLSLIKVLEEEMPYIERDEQLLCDSLHNTDPYLRLQGSGILAAIIVAAPQHIGVVTACNRSLLDASADNDDDVRNNSLFALVMNPAPATQASHDVFMRAFTSTNYRTAELGAVGLLNETSSNSDANKKLVQDALESTADSKVRLNLLYAIAGSHARSDVLFEAAKKSMLSTDKETSMAAIDAMAACSTSPDKLQTSLGPLVSAPEVQWEIKTRAQAALARAGSPH